MTDSNPEGGFIWHWQGSGKSHDMVYSAVKLRRDPALGNPTIVVVSDRTDLDKQIHGVFLHCGFPNPVNATSTKHLKELLSQPTGRTVMTTIQKFQDAAEIYPVLTEQGNIFVLVDEAHRSQYRFFAANMRNALPNAIFVGFTGTPIAKRERDTFRVFGKLIDKYDHNQSVSDGVTVPIYYESRMPELSVGGETSTRSLIGSSGSRSRRSGTGYPEYATKEEVAIATERIEAICLDLIQHYERGQCRMDSRRRLLHQTAWRGQI